MPKVPSMFVWSAGMRDSVREVCGRWPNTRLRVASAVAAGDADMKLSAMKGWFKQC